MAASYPINLTSLDRHRLSCDQLPSWTAHVEYWYYSDTRLDARSPAEKVEMNVTVRSRDAITARQTIGRAYPGSTITNLQEEKS